MSDDIQNAVLLSTFYSGRKRYKLYFHRNQIVWDNEHAPYAQRTVPLENVISVEYKYLESGSSQGPAYDPYHFTIHYAEKKPFNLWTYNKLTLRHSDVLQVSSWVKTLQNHLQSFCKRPKRLLLFINPFGGKKRAMQIFEKYGKPLFQIAGVDVSVIVSQRQNQIRDILINHNLDMFDSVVCVGGDGTVSEVFNGLVIRECRLLGINEDEVNENFPKPSLPVGIIPGGSTDSIVYCLHGTTDITTAVLHIILGDSLGLDLVSVHDENHLVQLIASVVSYGYLGDVAHNSESLRWMGPSRYEFCGVKKLIANKGYKGEIDILSDGVEVDPLKCCKNCDKCFISPEVNKTETQWKTLQGNFFMISAANISCACNRSPNGIAPYSHLGDGYLHVVLMHHTSLFNTLRVLRRFTKSTYTTDDLPFIEVHRAKEICFRVENSNKRSHWNCDGEVIQQSDIRARVHRQLLTVFGRGSSIHEDSNKKCTFCKF